MVMKDFISIFLICVLSSILTNCAMATAANNTIGKIRVAVAMCEIKNATGYQLRRGVNVNTFERQQNQVIALLKSLVTTWNRSSTGNESLEFIIVSNTEEGNANIRNEVNSWRPEYTMFLTLSFRPVKYPIGLEWLEKQFSRCASLKLFMSELLPDVERIISLDTDIVLLRDVRDLWKHFEDFNNDTLFAAAPGVGLKGTKCLNRIVDSMPVPVKIRGQRRNPGVLLMDLAKLRQSNWLSWIQTMGVRKELFAQCPGQAVLNLYLYQYPETLQRLPRNWNFFPVYFKSTSKQADLQLISALHGCNGEFMYNGTIANAVYQEFLNLDLRNESWTKVRGRLGEIIDIASNRKCTTTSRHCTVPY